MRIIVSDSSCLIDLQRGGLLEVFLELPYEFVIPDVLFHNELLSFSRKEKSLIMQRMTVASLEAAGVERVSEVLAFSPALSTYDGFAFVVAEERLGSILLTGDRRLNALAEAEQIEVHGVLWVVDQLAVHRKASREMRLSALEAWRDHPTSRLPKTTLGRMIAELIRHS
jgi:predicted nucleic acid-binding protein